jgi:tripartite-type tricarboxylate transporter receptor subunit TctC
MSTLKKLTTVTVAAVLATAVAGPVSAQGAADFYSGKTVRIIVSYGAGGSYGLYALLLANHMKKHMPADTKIIKQHMPGAGGTKALNYHAGVAPHDGTVIGMHPEVMAINQLIRKKGIKYNAADFRFLGSVTPVNPVLMAWHKSPVRNIDDVRKRVTIHSCSGTGSQTFIMPSMLNAFTGTKFKLVCGYKGSATQTLALQRGEVEVQSSAIISWRVRHADWLRDKKIFPLVQIGLTRDKHLPNIPLMSELTDDAKAKRTLEFISSGSPIGRSFVVHKDVPADRLAFLKKAFRDTVSDPAFLKEAKGRNANIEFTPGEPLDAIVAETLKTPKEIVTLAQSAIKQGRAMKTQCTKNCTKKKKKKK